MSLLGPGECLGRRGRGQKRGGGGYNMHTQCKKKEKTKSNTFLMRISGENYASRN